MNTRKKQIIDAAYLLFVDKGYAATSIQDILDKAKISKGTFYNHFTSKAECLRAILEYISEEIGEKRREAAEGRSIADPGVLADQISIRMQMSRERNLFALYESVFYSEDTELKAFAKEQHIRDLTWLAGRLPEVYGSAAEPYALENASLVLGTIQHLLHLYQYGTSTELPSDRLTAFVLRRMEAALGDQIEKQDKFLPFALGDLKKHAPDNAPTLQNRLRAVADASEGRAAELADFIADELEERAPRRHLIGMALSGLEAETLPDGSLAHDIRTFLAAE
ncbi:TetR/AcrR family transcriptional regulator [Indiicoccus explosivorum]|uniref:TetR/AcrR family transcriptional regulator n=1 Tax=Indiicoccus explosivorum TaxID=1917864 RepID=UPI000B447490|nr:TetR/AcrR family transcriptional regulator [Indiicoccus explosivorum]